MQNRMWKPNKRHRSAVWDDETRRFQSKDKAFAWRRDPLAGRDGCGMADNGHDVTMAARLGSQNAKAILDIMNVTRSTSPARTSCDWFSDGCFIFLNNRDAGPIRTAGPRNSWFVSHLRNE
jgi:hypothetical protein